MKILAASVIVLLSACGTNNSETNNSQLMASSGDHVAAAVKGCYKVKSIKIEESALPEHPAVKSPLSAKKLCIEDTKKEGSVSRSGRMSITAKTASDKIVGGTWGMNIPDAQPKCIGCYALSGFDGSLFYNAGKNIFDKKQPISVSLNINSLQTKYSVLLGEKTK